MTERVSINGITMYLETCCECRVPFCMDAATYNTMQRLKEGGSLCCPLGHKQHYISGERIEDRLRRENERLKQEQARLIDERREAQEDAKKQIAIAKGKVTRIKNRVYAGVCPDCNRSFSNMARHMKTQHPKCTEVTQ